MFATTCLFASLVLHLLSSPSAAHVNAGSLAVSVMQERGPTRGLLGVDVDRNGRRDLLLPLRDESRVVLLSQREDGSFEDLSAACGLADRNVSAHAWLPWEGDASPALILVDDAGRATLLRTDGVLPFPEEALGELAQQLGSIEHLEPFAASSGGEEGKGPGGDALLITSTTGHWLVSEREGRLVGLCLVERGSLRAGLAGRSASSTASATVGPAGPDVVDGEVRISSGRLVGSSLDNAPTTVPSPDDDEEGAAITTTRTFSGTSTLLDSFHDCVTGIVDTSNGACLQGSSVPTLGQLYPLSADLFVDGLGRVGVGTLTPSAPLTVLGDSVQAVSVRSGDLALANDARLTLDDDFQNPGAVAALFGIDELALGVDASWDTVRVGPTGALRLRDTGHVGIGVSQPDRALEVRGDGVRSVRVEDGSLELGSSATLRVQDDAQVPLEALGSFGTGDLYLGFDSQWDTLRLGPAGSIAVTSTGLGVGTNAPQVALDVRGSGVQAMRVEDGSLELGSSASITAQNTSLVPLNALTSSGTDELYLGFDPQWNRVRVGPVGNMTLTDTGRVGMGTSAPTTQLDVRGDGVTSMRVDDGSLDLGGSSGLRVENASLVPLDAVTSFGADDLYLGFDPQWNSVRLGPTGAVALLANGNLGVGTSLPQEPLEVRGNGVTAARVDDGSLALGGSSTLTLDNASLVPLDAVTSFGGDDLFLGFDAQWSSVRLGPTGQATLTQAGRFGVGTSAPDRALDVRGDGLSALRVDDGSLELGSSSRLDAIGAGNLPLEVVGADGGGTVRIAGDSQWARADLGPASNVRLWPNGSVVIGTPAATTVPLLVDGGAQQAVRVENGRVALDQDGSVTMEDASQVERTALSTAANTLLVGPDGWSDVALGLQSTLRVTAGGSVGIGVTSPTNVLTVEQGSTTDPVADAWTVYSSKRWKRNVRTFEEPLETVRRLRGVRYEWKETGLADVGFLAEEVGEVLPELVTYEPNGEDARSVDYARITAVLVEAVKAQQERIEELERRLTLLTSDAGDAALRSSSAAGGELSAGAR